MSNDLLPFKHGEEGTHSACPEMIEKLGDKVGCCTCNNHQCKDTQPTDQKPIWEEAYEAQMELLDDEDEEDWIKRQKEFISQVEKAAYERGRAEQAKHEIEYRRIKGEPI